VDGLKLVWNVRSRDAVWCVFPPEKLAAMCGMPPVRRACANSLPRSSSPCLRCAPGRG
jgi:hypothetical protein